MYLLIFISTFIVATHATLQHTHFDSKIIQEIESKKYDSFYTGKDAAREITLTERKMCHDGVRSKSGRLCNAYKTPISTTSYPSLNDTCLNVTWTYVNTQTYNPLAQTGYGNCVSASTDKSYRYVHSNSVPPYYMNPYCPFGLNNGYCIEGEPCPFPNIVCGVTKSEGFTALGDVWVR